MHKVMEDHVLFLYYADSLCFTRGKYYICMVMNTRNYRDWNRHLPVELRGYQTQNLPDPLSPSFCGISWSSPGSGMLRKIYQQWLLPLKTNRIERVTITGEFSFMWFGFHVCVCMSHSNLGTNSIIQIVWRIRNSTLLLQIVEKHTVCVDLKCCDPSHQQGVE